MMIVTDKKPRVQVESILTEAERHEITHYMHHYPDPRAASLDALKIVQRRQGWVDDAQVAAVAQMLGISTADVEGVATFYNRIYRQPVGRHVILMCDSIACYLMGQEDLAAAVMRHLNIGWGQTTADGRFTLLPICCLGHCDHAPAVLIDEDTHGLVSVDNFVSILEGYV